MAYSCVPEPLSCKLSLAEFVSKVEAIDLSDRMAIWSLRRDIASLANNHDEIIRRYRDQIKSKYILPGGSASSVLLHKAKDFAIRLNIWLPEKENENRVWENYLGAYYFPHDHNFDLLSANVFGPGYRTRVIELDEGTANIKVGSIVKKLSDREYRLKPGSTIFYSKSTDLHIQLPPKSISATLNLLPTIPCDFDIPQRIFKVTDRHVEVIGYPFIRGLRRAAILRIAAKLVQTGRSSDDPATLSAIARHISKSRMRFGKGGDGSPATYYVREIEELFARWSKVKGVSEIRSCPIPEIPFESYHSAASEYVSSNSNSVCPGDPRGRHHA